MREGWSKAENFVWTCAKAGLEANFDISTGYDLSDCVKPRRKSGQRIVERFGPDCHTLPSTVASTDVLYGRVIRSRFVETILSDPEFQKQIGPVGLRIVGAVFVERLVLENAKIGPSLVLDDSVFGDGVNLDGISSSSSISLEGALVCGTLSLKRANILGTLFMKGSYFGGIEATDINVAKGFTIDRSVVFNLFWLDRAQIGKLFSAKSSLLTHFLARSATFDGDVNFHFSQIRCLFSLSGSKLNGSLAVVNSGFGKVATLDETLFYSWPKPHALGKGRYNRFAQRKMLWAAINALSQVNDQVPTCKRGIVLERIAVHGSVCLSNIMPAPNDERLSGKNNNFIISTDIATIDNALAISWREKDDSINRWLLTNIRSRWLYSDLINWPANYSIVDTVYENLSLTRKACEAFLNKTKNEIGDVEKIDIRNTADAAPRVLDWIKKSAPDSTQPYVMQFLL